MESTNDSSEIIDMLVEYITNTYEDLHATTGRDNTMHGPGKENYIYVYRYYRNHFESVSDLKLPVCTLIFEDVSIRIVEGTWNTDGQLKFDLYEPSSIPDIVDAIFSRQRYLP